ncbi:MAG TPA: hypothetical protein VMT67_07725 [Terriglobales bacterium]|nr:hypothetical protein [Terriglobales bacterium]
MAAYLFPFCLEAWREDLRGLTSEYGGFVEYLYPVLANKRTGEHLDPKRMAAVADFMKRTILEEIDDQRGLIYSGGAARPYRWIRALTTYGVLFPDLDRLWSAWWSIETVGKATAIVQYASCLMYPTDENPVFARWTPEGGGGPPCLWEFAGHLYNHQWLDANVAFLKDMLTVQRTIETVDKAVKRLVSEAEFSVAAEIQSDMPLCTETLASRCAELPNMLATDEASKTHEWSL